MTLGIDVAVAGAYDPLPLPEATGIARIGEYAVALEGELLPGEASELTLTVSRNDRPVTDLQSYLAAYGHLVALRVGDLGYLHVHPEEGPAGPGIDFATAFPEPATYRLFLDFQHRGQVHTAAFTVESGGAPATDGSDDDPDDDSGHAEEGDHDH